MAKVFSLLFSVLATIVAVQSKAQPVALAITKKEVLALVHEHPEWEGVDIKQLSKEEAKKAWGGQGGENVRFNNIPLFSHLGQMHVMFSKRKGELRVNTYWWTTRVTSSDSLSHLRRIYDMLCDSLSAKLNSQGKEYGKPEKFHQRVWNRGPENYQVSLDPEERMVSVRANYLPMYE